ncbi:MAG: ABC transporter permease subunit [Clostridiaceae bacterium]|nr:ABC transporter permease subunit [Clostridiaceae bacterium]
MRTDGKRSGRLAWIWVTLVWLAIWQGAYLLVGQDLLLASPWQVLQRLALQGVRPSFWLTVLYSFLRIQAGFLLGLACGSLLAVLTVRLAWVKRLFHPAISAIRATPVASFIILALVWMSHNRVVVFIVFLMVLPIVWRNVTEGIETTDPQLLEMGRVFHLSRLEVVRAIYIPSVVPFFVTAATTSLGLGWKAGIAAEVLSRPPLSLGRQLYDAKIYLETADLLAFTSVVIIISLALEHLLLLLFRQAGRLFQRRGITGRKAGPAA